MVAFTNISVTALPAQKSLAFQVTPPLLPGSRKCHSLIRVGSQVRDSCNKPATRITRSGGLLLRFGRVSVDFCSRAKRVRVLTFLQLPWTSIVNPAKPRVGVWPASIGQVCLSPRTFLPWWPLSSPNLLARKSAAVVQSASCCTQE